MAVVRPQAAAQMAAAYMSAAHMSAAHMYAAAPRTLGHRSALPPAHAGLAWQSGHRQSSDCITFCDVPTHSGWYHSSHPSHIAMKRSGL